MGKTRFCYLDNNISYMKALDLKMKLSCRDKKNYHLCMTHGMRPGKYIVEGLQEMECLAYLASLTLIYL
jgi:hypothetical protein